MKMHETKNDTPSNTKQVSIELLNARLADAIDLALITKQAHWNLKGPRFIAIHELLDTFRAAIDEHVDIIAERAVQLGGTAFGTKETVSETSKLKAYPTDIYKIEAHLAALIDRYADTANAVRKSIDEADEAGDADTADIFTAFSRSLDKNLWFLEAHVQENA
ncbi:DNA starvation/stationary phase protection protein Dps [Tianweitania sp. BSSL-BM11]|uniref:DNA starvation/stationary phase protection protein Dps n=1 Tax=Tianweitania aestuarii TaxID=2814886 RepID=A0ABS5RZM7_9HYPH|nr:DNA starvation/stationary phase protection protein Dps [Tianweitania aestuarii]MBS9722488.1 DNA starvation/stationary phase protection protein Dps [Tianweitania aestuarii]